MIRSLPAVLVTLSFTTAQAADLDEARRLHREGRYAECIQVAEKAVATRVRDEDWPTLLIRSQLALGRYAEAEASLTNALTRYSTSVRLRVLGCEVVSSAGKPERVAVLLREINELGGSRMYLYRDAPNLVALGRAAVMLGADPKLVLENFYDRAKKADPNSRDAYLATGELALQEHDYELAARSFDEALKKFPDDPDILFGLARAYEPSATSLMLKWIEATLTRNTNHAPALLLLADHQVDAEGYAAADEILEQALAVNPAQPEAWAYKAVLAHLRNDPDGETRAREKALQVWTTNPEVDHIIGRKLSQNYRFAEGSRYQRSALGFDGNYLPARIQLAQDLLRLGDEAEGWKLAEEVHQRNGYDVTAFNLVNLKETLAKFRDLTNEHFIVRMAPREARLYGDQVLELLNRAYESLGTRYGLQPDQPTLIEIFPEQKDFGVRTFGMPHNPGFLGVCFGHVVTANSPASQAGNPSNWEAVLWHEFCHVITLQLTKNKMPRWLSEGISVYEEIRANPTWGQAMNPKYREMILNGELTPVSRLSSAFLSPKSSLHVQFAYFQSCLVVEYLVNRFGFESLKLILQDLGNGTSINDAITKRTAPMEIVEKEFEAFARDRAEKLAPGLDWEKPQTAVASTGPGRQRLGLGNPVQVAPTTNTNSPAVPAPAPEKPRSAPPGAPNYWRLARQAGELVSEKQWEAAKAPLQKLIELYPNQTGSENAYVLLAAAHRSLRETDSERDVLTRLAALDPAAPDAYSRLMELGESAKDWPTVETNAQRFLAVNPLLASPHRYLALASEELGRTNTAIGAYRKVLLLSPPDPSEVHFRLARLLQKTGDPLAKRQVLQALEEAPRFRDAQQLLLELAETAPAEGRSPAPAADGDKARP